MKDIVPMVLCVVSGILPRLVWIILVILFLNDPSYVRIVMAWGAW